MTTTLIVATVLLWIVVGALILTVLALSRQIGVLYERVAPMGALTMDKGPSVGDESPRFEVDDIVGKAVRIGYPGRKSQLLFFVSPSCPVCKKMLPIVKSVSGTEGGWLDIVLVSDGDPIKQNSFYKRAELQQFPYVLSAEVGMRFQIGRIPYGMLINENGIVSAKGLINSREQLESLFTAKELGVGSAQEWLARQETPQSDH